MEYKKKDFECMAFTVKPSCQVGGCWLKPITPALLQEDEGSRSSGEKYIGNLCMVLDLELIPGMVIGSPFGILLVNCGVSSLWLIAAVSFQNCV